MKGLLRPLLVAVLAGLPATALAVRCGDAPTDAAAVCTARALADAQCNCATAPTHGNYVRCVSAVARAEVGNGHLPRQCRHNVVRCAAKSTCGRAGAVTCCRIFPVGVEKCSVKRSASLCKAPSGGTASIGSRPSCCDACVDGCPSVSTTSSSSTSTSSSTTSTSTTTSSLPMNCGNNVRDPGEECDGLDVGGATCGSAGGSFPCPTCNGDCTLDCSCCVGGTCATTTTTSTSFTTTTSTSVTTTTVICEPIVPGQPIPNTYSMLGVAGPKMCITGATNQFQTCNGDGDCGGASGSCLQTPWVTADGFAFGFPTNISTTFTVAAADSPPTCSHAACIKCGNPNAACTGIPGCGTPPAPPTSPCFKNTCCDDPGFTVPTFIVPILGGLCGRVDQYACGVGVVNTSHPQTGDNEVNKTGDTSDPGPDCMYGTLDDPAAKPCNTSPTGAGADTKGKVVRTQGNGTVDADGIQFRLSTPELATVWQDGQGCPNGATYDNGELLVSQLGLNAEPSTAGTSARFMDLNGDNCPRAGSGFSSASPNGPITVGPPAAQPAPYSGGGSVGVASGPVLSGAAPLYDIGFVAITPNAAATLAPAEACSCVPVAGCPE